jgi:hypothetical protein
MRKVRSLLDRLAEWIKRTYWVSVLRGETGSWINPLNASMPYV